MSGRNKKLKQYPEYCPFPSGQTITGKLLDVYDGDTFWLVTTDLDNTGIEKRVKVRLAGINTPEMKTKSIEAENAKNELIRLLENKIIKCKIFGIEKYGRPLVLVSTDECQNINKRLVELNLAILFMDTYDIMNI